MDINDCFEKKLLRKDVPDKEKSNKSIEIAKHKLDIAKRSLNAGIFEEAVSNSYSAMFHASRALLFRDGISEKSHYAVFVYIKEKYADKIEKRFVHEFNNLRTERHEINYGLDKPEVEESESEDVIKTAEEFVEVVEKILRK